MLGLFDYFLSSRLDPDYLIYFPKKMQNFYGVDHSSKQEILGLNIMGLFKFLIINFLSILFLKPKNV